MGAERGLHAEIIAVGTELLLGEGVDTNSAWISARLAQVGVDVFRHRTVGDNVERITEELRAAVRRADAVVVTGGLGPTQDDVTRLAVARLAGVELQRHDDLVTHLEAHFARAGRSMPSRNLAQADLPAGAHVLAPVGTAAGFAMEIGDAVVYCLPGVPAEMETMVARSLLPDLVERGGLATTVSRVVRTAGMSESGVAERCASLVARLDAHGNPTVAFLASRGETRVRVTAKAASREDARALIDPVIDEITELLGTSVVGVDDAGVEHAVAGALQQAGWTLAVAESISGGNLGARLVRVPGASQWFRGGLIVYDEHAKTTLGGVPADVLAAHGPVSEPVAGALAAGARDRLDADVGLAVVGVAGPTTQGGREVGTVCVGVVTPGGPHPQTRSVVLPVAKASAADTVDDSAGQRARTQAQEWSASLALDHLRRRLRERAGEAAGQHS